MPYNKPILTDNDNIVPAAGSAVVAVNVLIVGNTINTINVYNAVNLLSEVSVVTNVNITIASK